MRTKFVCAVLLLMLVFPLNAFKLYNIRFFTTRNFCLSDDNIIEDVSSTAAFDNLINNPSLIPFIIDYQKSQCKPCKRIAPDFEKLAIKYSGKAKFYKIDADSSKEALGIMKLQGVRSVPTFHIYKDGKRIESVQGANLDELEIAIADACK